MKLVDTVKKALGKSKAKRGDRKSSDAAAAVGGIVASSAGATGTPPHSSS